MLGYCGLDCETCQIHRATVEPDLGKRQTMREEIAHQCTEIYGIKLDPGEVNDCDGCLSPSGQIFSGCAKCEIRRCASGKRLLTCAFCPEFSCKLLEKQFSMDPSARARLEAIRNPRPSLNQ